jgi:hyperosmotically inducible protein
MLKKLSVVTCGFGVVLMTAGAATAQTATQEAKDKTQAAAGKTATVMTDAEITSAVKTKLLGDKVVGGLKLDVDTTNGVVTLTGPVTSAAERNEALRLARTTKGVKSVVNKLTMDTTATTGKVAKDEAGDAKDSTKSAAKKTGDAIGTAAKKTGSATENAAKKTGNATEDAAKKTGNATENAAKKTATVMTDAEITSAVKTKLLGDKAVGGMKVDVDTSHGVVTLTGPVYSTGERDEALRLARTTKGVKSVVNKLTVEPKK